MQKRRKKLLLFPAIDLKDGECVRLKRGQMNAATVFNKDPTDQAKYFEALGFEYLHLVDLNGAFEGRPINITAVSEILRGVKIPVQLGGGIRDLMTVRSWIEKGVKRVILGTSALRDPELVRTACKEFPGSIVVGIDAKKGKVAIEGWAETSNIVPIELAKRLEDCGVSAIIYTDIERDGVLEGLNLSATLNLACSVSIPIIASGGLNSIEDIRTMMLPEYEILEGAIIGRALYESRLNPKEALHLINSM
ncbi:MAG: 1-(5-phosphoribosyl)-5-[(5-phosphoribosylamino)methylideneamino]imidazole-4-carboxamide isomerase [Hyphomicrobium sp.]